jgi:hypothetical protein
MIRPYESRDLADLKRIHNRSGLPPNCWPNIDDKLYTVRIVAEENGRAVQGGFVKLTGEAYVLVDHDHADPESRWKTLQDLIIRGLHDAARPMAATCPHCHTLFPIVKGLEDVSCWLPPSLERAFWPRLKSLGFEKSPWQCCTALLK